MKKKLIAVAMSAGLMLGGANLALAGHGGAGHEPRDNGLCNAFFRGEKKGWDKRESKGKTPYPPPFQDLVSRAEQNTGDGSGDPETDPTGADAVREFCGALAPAPGSPGTDGGRGSGNGKKP